mmetsp:Transcript_28591/g.51833  ORF Transcript_28591/g.51833 Transcript_28591/m.51833 type:complete len:827 (-) Transcript_28591:30-2510(-)
MLPSKPQTNSNLGQKNTKGEGDLSDGPVRNRHVTDCACTLLFVCQAGCFWFLSGKAISAGGDISTLFLPRDFRGDYCGVSSGGGNLSFYPELTYSLSVSTTVDPIAYGLLCSSAGEAMLSSDVFAEACSGSSSSGSSYSLSDIESMLSDPSQIMSTFSSSLSSLSMSQIVDEALQYFNQVCASSCSPNSTTSGRTWTYSPPPNAVWAEAWNEMMETLSDSGAGSSLQIAISQLQFEAWSYEDCPYAGRYCIPFPMISFSTGVDNYCAPADLGSMEAALGDALEGVNVTDAFQSVSSSISDFATTLDALGVVAAASVVIGLLFMLGVRMFAKPIIWLCIFSIFVILAAGGYASVVRANQCAGSSFVDASQSLAEATASKAVSTISNATNISSPVQIESTDSSCSDGYAVTDETLREVLLYCGYALLSMAALWLLLIICMCSRIRLAIAITQVGSAFVESNPQTLLVPILQIIVGSMWMATWGVCAAFMVSYVPAGYVPSQAYATEAEAAGNATASGACNSRWPTGFAYEDFSECTSTNSTVSCWYCGPPRFMLGEEFAYAFFCLLWHNAFLIALGQCIIAGAVGTWFFANNADKGSEPVLCRSTRNALCYNFGSLAFGSLIIAIVQFLKWVMRYLAEQAKAQKNRVAVVVFRALASCLWCFEKCIKFLNKNAYIQVALKGTPFCTSAKEAFFLILRNIVRFGALAMLGRVVDFLGISFITTATAIVGYFVLQALYPDANPIVPLACYILMGYLVARLFLNVYALACDTSLQCFIIAEEMEHRGDFIPSALQSFIKQNDLQEVHEGGCCSCCSSRKVADNESPEAGQA